MYYQWCWYVIWYCHFIVLYRDQLWQTSTFSVSGLLSHITILIFIFSLKNIISLPFIVRGNYIQQEFTKHKQALVSYNLTWCTELTPDCDHIYFYHVTVCCKIFTLWDTIKTIQLLFIVSVKVETLLYITSKIVFAMWFYYVDNNFIILASQKMPFYFLWHFYIKTCCQLYTSSWWLRWGWVLDLGWNIQ